MIGFFGKLECGVGGIPDVWGRISVIPLLSDLRRHLRSEKKLSLRIDFRLPKFRLESKELSNLRPSFMI
jgi:hypothetical protein